MLRQTEGTIEPISTSRANGRMKCHFLFRAGKTNMFFKLQNDDTEAFMFMAKGDSDENGESRSIENNR